MMIVFGDEVAIGILEFKTCFNLLLVFIVMVKLTGYPATESEAKPTYYVYSSKRVSKERKRLAAACYHCTLSVLKRSGAHQA